ncbi:NADH-quinone oxidoreductase subunit NuoE [Aureimonas populi]|uniref:NADH-quinone oxidoreductase subunit NuoE n=1 Tax=Aureimonas populi TaxID=1701758 RepID=A0ABW5CF39_9HYPH|nr:NADH-quinone oxidoreductase subunit NuoE [Aureimonas populi]
MSVRRLAEDAVQPTSFAFSVDNESWAEKTIRKYPEGRQQSAVIPLLMRAQEQDGWVTRAAIEHVAKRLSMPLIRVLEVATFYTQFQLKPIGTKAHIQICGTTPCMLRGSDDLKAVCARRIHAEQFHLNAAGTLSWEEVECLGACVNAPMAMVFKDTYEDLTPERLEEIIDAFERGEEVRPGPQIDRHLSAPVGGATTLTSLGDDDELGDRDEGPVRESAPQAGAGDAVHIAPSEAGRVDTHAEETDPSLRSPGAEAGVTASPAAEEAVSADPGEDGRSSAAVTGGTRQGSTGAHAKEAQADEAAKRHRTAGKRAELPAREAEAEAAVVDDKSRVVDNESSAKKPRARRKVDKASSDGSDGANGA